MLISRSFYTIKNLLLLNLCLLLCITLIAIIFSSCVSCPDNRGNIVVPKFYLQGNSVNSHPYNTIYFVERNTFLPANFNSLSLDVERNRTTYILSNSVTGLSDTLIFSYRSDVEYLDRECGIQFEITNLQVRSSYRETRIVNFNDRLNEWEINFYR